MYLNSHQESQARDTLNYVPFFKHISCELSSFSAFEQIFHFPRQIPEQVSQLLEGL